MFGKKTLTEKYWFFARIWIGFVIVAGIIMFTIGPSLVPPPSSEVERLVGNAGVVFAIRFPALPGQREELIRAHLFSEFGTSDENVTLFRHPADREPGDEIIDVEISQEEWEPMHMLVRDWCYNPPTFQSIEEAPFFDVGYYCAGDKRVQIPVDELPPELVRLIETVPSPTCDNPFCGWQDEVME
jgi:hypothetical protein